MKLNLNQITISVSNVERSIAFYEQFGLKLIVKALPHYARFECLSGDSTFSLHYSNDRVDGATWIYFETETLDEDASALMEKGVVFETGPTDQEWLWREARLKDPDGNQLILYYAGKNRKDPPWKVK
ncbi:bleomycin resistance protein [Mucilaginibacter sp. PPCGB 2223]|uniref:VOC family protein n=1 Tax=Mucilaginibacter sp. PPCGB 2223 TaxID=1886027 RepID=UPI000825ADBD|nr:VOC family protein [Mucilaginibacter sp. PPCGB 2223]OCX52957.1 bleomycin resistance protein [Mucilaginibacter sp. PPCGB 2223]